MSEQGLAVGRDALARAMELARKSSRAARVMALVVPLAALAAQHQAHASVAGPGPAYSGSATFSFSSSGPGVEGNSYGQSGTVSWDVTPFVVAAADPWHYDITFSVTSGFGGNGPSGLTEVDIPFDYQNVFGLELTTDGSNAVLFDVSFSDGLSEFTPSGAPFFPSEFDLSFNSDSSPMLVPYQIAGSGGGSGTVDPPVPAPEPGTLSLFGMALLGFGALRRRLTG